MGVIERATGKVRGRSHHGRLVVLLVLVSALAAFLLGFGSLATRSWGWRESAIYQAIDESNPPPFWWPPGWRREWGTSLTLEGELRDPRSGELEFVAGVGDRVIRVPVSRGRYSLRPRLLPAGPVRVRFLSPDGTGTGWLELGDLDPGRHRINLAF